MLRGSAAFVFFGTNYVSSVDEIVRVATLALKRNGLEPAAGAQVGVTVLLGEPDSGCAVDFADPRNLFNCAVRFDASGAITEVWGEPPPTPSYDVDVPRSVYRGRAIVRELSPEEYMLKGAEYE
jgi:hypothetical protein